MAKWTPEEIHKLRHLYPLRLAYILSQELGRPARAIASKANRLGLKHQKGMKIPTKSHRNPFLAEWSRTHIRRGPRPEMAGEGNPMFGKKRPDLAEFNRRRRELGYPASWTGKHLSEESKRKNALAHKGKRLSPEHRAKIAEANRKRSPEVLMKVIKGLRLRPTRPEKQLIDIFGRHNLPFRYVGDGQVIISGLFPDFINVNGRKEIIELFGEYWHERATKPTQTEHGRGAIFKGFGYRTLVIWTKELKDEERVVAKIKAFTEG